MLSFAEKTFQLALNASHVSIWEWQVAEKKAAITKEALAILKLANSDDFIYLLSQPEKYFTAEDSLKLQSAIAKIKSAQFVEFELDLCYQPRHIGDGHSTWLRICAAAERNEAGEVILIAGTLMEITKRKKIQAALEEERYRLKTLIENLPLNIYFKDRDSKFVMANTSTAKRLGCETEEDILQKTDNDFFKKKHADFSRQQELRIMATQQAEADVLVHEYWGSQKEQTKDDTWVIVSKIPWLNRQGEVCGVFGVTSDVSELIKTQIDLLKTTQRLEKQNQRIKEEIALAKEIQNATIGCPRIDCFHHNTAQQLSIAYCYLPMAEMAGDYYQVFAINERQLGVFICDVMGHGVQSALIVSMLKGLIEKEKKNAQQPERFLANINDSLIEILQGLGKVIFASALYGVINVDDLTFCYVNAGHPRPIIMRKSSNDDTMVALDTPNAIQVALGIEKNIKYTVTRQLLQLHDQILCYTDGAYEEQNSKQEAFGMENLIDYLTALPADKSVNDRINHVLGALRDFTKEQQYNDDICFVGIAVEPRSKG